MQGVFHSHVHKTMLTYDILPDPNQENVLLGADFVDIPAPTADFVSKFIEDANPISGETAITRAAKFDQFRVVPGQNGPPLDMMTLCHEWVTICYPMLTRDQPTFIPWLDGRSISKDVLGLLSVQPLLLSLSDADLILICTTYTSLLGRDRKNGTDENQPTKQSQIEVDAIWLHLRFALNTPRRQAAWIRCVLSEVTWRLDRDQPAYATWRNTLRDVINREKGFPEDTSYQLRQFCDFHFVSSKYIVFDTAIQHAGNHVDEQYAKYVKGAMVNTSMDVVWTPADETMHSKIDDESFNNVMWVYLQGYIKQILALENDVSIKRDPIRQDMAEIVRRVKVRELQPNWS
jgi:hypothetical protein